jgi:UDP-galactopyranose mutase
MYDYLVVGAGFAGATLAERLASDGSTSVLLIDQRHHVGGNCYDPVAHDGLRRHQYGPHIFHTNAPEVAAYLSRFTAWRPYEHRVLARVRGKLVPIPINRTTVNALYGLSLDSDGVATFLAGRAVPMETVRNSRDAIVSRVGVELYELFFAGYTRKHWGLDPAQLDATVCGRIPTRVDDDDRYFNDRFQAMPRDGFTAMFERMVSAPNIEVALGVSYREAADRVRFAHLIYTGPIDEYFDYRYGKLPYRSLRFEFEVRPGPYAQAAGCVNEPDESVPFTRTTDYAYLTGQTGPITVISREYSSGEGDPYYPIPCPENRALYQRYASLAAAQRHVTFAGRLAEYRYYNMDQVVASALVKYRDLVSKAA